MQDAYVDALIRELQYRSDYIESPVRTIYIGGGTPSVLSAFNLERLINTLTDFATTHGDALEEFTIECNPDDISSPDSPVLGVISKSAVNRVSMGAQTFSDERLSFLHRRHKASDVENAVSNLRNIGIDNISVDLMFGFPDETLEEWVNDIDILLSYDVCHISAYSLMYEEGTPLFRFLEHGKIKEIDEELSLRMYEALIDKLESAGYEHYEISNFSKQGKRSKHNSSYWQAVPYLGLGASAHSYNGVSRQWNVSDIRSYINDFTSPEVEILDEQTRYNDLVTTAMRTCEGIDTIKMCELMDIPYKYKEYLIQCAQPLVRRGLLKMENGMLSLTRKGLFVSDSVMSELISIK